MLYGRLLLSEHIETTYLFYVFYKTLISFGICLLQPKLIPDKYHIKYNTTLTHAKLP